MGLYTELIVGFELIGSPPESVINTLKWMCGIDETPPNDRNELTKYFSYGLLTVEGAGFFPASSNAVLYVDFIGAYHLSVRSVIKNYSKEWQRFLQWIAPYVLIDGFIGYMRDEEEEFPTLT